MRILGQEPRRRTHRGLWQVYFSDPASEPDPATWRTEIVQPNPPV